MIKVTKTAIKSNLPLTGESNKEMIKCGAYIKNNRLHYFADFKDVTDEVVYNKEYDKIVYLTIMAKMDMKLETKVDDIFKAISNMIEDYMVECEEYEENELDEVITFSEASELVGKAPNYFTELVKRGALIKGKHYRMAGRIGLILKSVAESYK